MRSTRADWSEKDHPRHLRGSEKGGRFRGGADWASRVDDLLPIAGGGSIATGLTNQCPVCGRTVKVVGSGKQSTHNASKGKRCSGSGLQVLGKPPKRAGPSGGSRRGGPKKGPPVPPQVTIGSPLQLTQGAAADRMRAWVAATIQPGLTRETKLEYERRSLAQTVEIRRKALANQRLDQARALEYEIRSREGLGWNTSVNVDKYKEEKFWGWPDSRNFHEELEVRLQPYVLKLEEKLADLEDLESRRGRFASSIWDDPAQYGQGRPAQTLDPARPLSIYGDMLHVEDDVWHTYQALDSLEQRVPPIFHEAVAAHLAENNGGIWIAATKPLWDLDSLQYLKPLHPKGWRKGAEWSEVDGVVSGGTRLGLTHTSNTESHRSSRRFNYGVEAFHEREMGNPNVQRQVDASAALHEFGHLLDYTIGYQSGIRPGGLQASAQRLWRLIHGKVRKQQQGISPYFLQKGDRGPEELWADAFNVWADVDPVPVTWSDGTLLPQPTGTKRVYTWQDRSIARTYRIPDPLAMEISDYFARLQKDLETGKRKTNRQRRNP